MYCKKIVDKYPEKNIVITGDHSERLSYGKGYDKKRYSHGGRKTKIICEVPWFCAWE